MPIAAEMPPEIDPQTAAQPKRRRRRCLTAFSRNTHTHTHTHMPLDGGGGEQMEGWMDGWMEAKSKRWENLALEGGEDGWMRREINRRISYKKFVHFIGQTKRHFFRLIRFFRMFVSVGFCRDQKTCCREIIHHYKRFNHLLLRAMELQAGAV